jgi:hypothetical protein
VINRGRLIAPIAKRTARAELPGQSSPSSTAETISSLIANANNQYEEYLAASKTANSLNELLETLDPKSFQGDGG